MRASILIAFLLASFLSPVNGQPVGQMNPDAPPEMKFIYDSLKEGEATVLRVRQVCSEARRIVAELRSRDKEPPGAVQLLDICEAFVGINQNGLFASSLLNLPEFYFESYPRSTSIRGIRGFSNLANASALAHFTASRECLLESPLLSRTEPLATRWDGQVQPNQLKTIKLVFLVHQLDPNKIQIGKINFAGTGAALGDRIGRDLFQLTQWSSRLGVTTSETSALDGRIVFMINREDSKTGLYALAQTVDQKVPAQWGWFGQSTLYRTGIFLVPERYPATDVVNHLKALVTKCHDSFYCRAFGCRR